VVAESPSTSAATPTPSSVPLAEPPPLRHPVDAHPTGRRLAVLSLTALGVVYGDIGTSPLYAIKECFKPEYGLTLNATNIYGVLSLIVWSLIVVISVKYVAYILRADNKGAGGVLAEDSDHARTIWWRISVR
jgi:KUP system potassium uptake protein